MRPWARLRAKLGGYFWLPCLHCGRMHGGHEVKSEHGTVTRLWNNRTSVLCPRHQGEHYVIDHAQRWHQIV
jgi:hypothetical protein